MEPSSKTPDLQGFQTNYIRRIPVQDMTLSSAKIALFRPVSVSMDVKLSVVQITDTRECKLVLDEKFKFSQGVSFSDSVQLPKGISVNTDR